MHGPAARSLPGASEEGGVLMGLGTVDTGALRVSHSLGRPGVTSLSTQRVLVLLGGCVCMTFFPSFMVSRIWDCPLVLPPAGLDAGKIKQVGTICGQESTRRIGDYKVKYGYTDIDLLR